VTDWSDRATAASVVVLLLAVVAVALLATPWGTTETTARCQPNGLISGVRCPPLTATSPTTGWDRGAGPGVLAGMIVVAGVTVLAWSSGRRRHTLLALVKTLALLAAMGVTLVAFVTLDFGEQPTHFRPNVVGLVELGVLLAVGVASAVQEGSRRKPTETGGYVVPPPPA
jgi:hypothetical protein